MRDKSLCRFYEVYSAIGGLQFEYVTCILAHLWLGDKAQNYLSLTRSGNEVRDVSVHRV